jgi:Protein of unknown function (DUF2971).
MLYKFLKLNEQNTHDHINGLLVNPQLKFTPVSKLNDPNEFKFFIDFDKRDKEKIELFWKANNINSYDGFENWYSKIDHNYIKLRETEWKLYHKNNYQVLSFSQYHKSNLLWSHYAGNDYGICVIYKQTLKEKLSGFDIVEMQGLINYQNNPPRIKEYEDTKREINKKIFFTKQKEWEYENEYRFITQNTSKDCVYLPIENDDIFGVIFGVNTNEKIVRSILTICNRYNYKKFQVHTYGSSYILKTVELDNDPLMITKLN